MRTNYSVVNVATGEVLATSPTLPFSPAPPGRPLGRLATFTEVGQEADGYRLVERVISNDKPSAYHRFRGETVKFDGQKCVVEYTYEAPSLAEIQARRITEIKMAAGTRILTAFPEYKQSNMLATAVELQNVWRRSGGWTPEQQALADVLDARWSWVSQVRSHSNALEAEVLALETVDAVIAWAEHDWPGDAP